MNITSKSRYAIKILLDLAKFQNLLESRSGKSGQGVQAGQTSSQRLEISERQKIPLKYLDQILIKLRKGELVTTVRGPNGGIKLKREASDITAWDIFTTVEEGFLPVHCLDSEKFCVNEVGCQSKDAWGMILDSLRSTLQGLTLDQLSKKSWNSENAPALRLSSRTSLSKSLGTPLNTSGRSSLIRQSSELKDQERNHG